MPPSPQWMELHSIESPGQNLASTVLHVPYSLESPGQNMALTVLYVPYSLGSGVDCLIYAMFARKRREGNLAAVAPVDGIAAE